MLRSGSASFVQCFSRQRQHHNGQFLRPPHAHTQQEVDQPHAVSWLLVASRGKPPRLLSEVTIRSKEQIFNICNLTRWRICCLITAPLVATFLTCCPVYFLLSCQPVSVAAGGFFPLNPNSFLSEQSGVYRHPAAGNTEHVLLVKFILFFHLLPPPTDTNEHSTGVKWLLLWRTHILMPVPFHKPNQTARLTVCHIKALGCIRISPMHAAVRSRVLNRNQDIGTLLLCFVQ